MNPSHLHWELRDLVTKPPEKSLSIPSLSKHFLSPTVYQSLSSVQILLSRSLQTRTELLSLLQKSVHANFLLQDAFWINIWGGNPSL